MGITALMEKKTERNQKQRVILYGVWGSAWITGLGDACQACQRQGSSMKAQFLEKKTLRGK